MDIQTLVKTVVAAFEDSAKLVRRIQQQRDASTTDPSLPEEPTADLLNSLTLGPVILRGHYDHDLKRFGEPYACGDLQAREQLKDVLINLQITLIASLNRSWMDNGDVDFTLLQTVSDDCRVNAGVCLGQLSQRLSDATKAGSMYPQQPGTCPPSSTLMPPMSPSLQYSSSRSTQSSTFSRGQTRTPNSVVEEFSNMKLYSNQDVARPPLKEADHDPSGQFPPPLFSTQRNFDGDVVSLRRPSSSALSPEDSILLSPTVYDASQESSSRHHSGELSERCEGSHSQSLQYLSRTSVMNPDGRGVDHCATHDFIDRAPSRTNGSEFSYGTMYDKWQFPIPSNLRPSPFSYRGPTPPVDYTSFEHVNYLRQNSRPPVPDPSRIQTNSPRPVNPQKNKHLPFTFSAKQPEPFQQPPREYYLRASVSAPIPVDNESPTRAPQSKTSISSLPSLPHSTGDRRPPSIASTTFSGPLNLPTDKNTLGFCRGAFRLFIGLEKKAFNVANRPVGMAGMMPYWRCEKCTFEGPCIINANGRKKEKVFDTRIRENEGILYRWAFLAKSHMLIKTIPEGIGARDGSYGSFGCLFCACEAGRRDWALSGNNIVNGSESTKSGKSGGSVGASTPTFGNVQSFMEHLQMHRREDMWPGIEMRGRMRAIVGRRPEQGEDYDVAFLPL